MNNEIDIIRQGKAYWIEAPRDAKIFHGDRSVNVDFNFLMSDGGRYLPEHVLNIAALGERGFRLIGRDASS